MNQLELLNKYIRSHYDSHGDFAVAIGMSRQGVNYAKRIAKENNGKLSFQFLKKLEEANIDIFSKDYETESSIDNIVASEPENLIISTLQRLVESQQKTIQLLEEQLGTGHEAPSKKRAS